jgi:hypothetical protein
MWAAVVLVWALGYVAYRLSFVVRAVRADRAGDREHADALRTRGSTLFLGATATITLLVLVVVALAIATR